ncbi:MULTISPECIES: tetratricopeptide repeat protein [unclassified Thalassospira]|uniref:tetratricopeptide repeat protein n=1 Tax=unclassified Thalassospira TaxID=2648997 RepID=UPI0007A5B5C5|nr:MULTISPECIES: tetratricopeptide repeat protein [unclassified Thalassospira]KZD00218.1 hypothetical protein AUQ41_06390 [Thalassospira sp. MCCC 1A02898]ONH87324.1 hypothetical protein TH47_13345 [Thalassospira sp. MCCC 1A02803]
MNRSERRRKEKQANSKISSSTNRSTSGALPPISEKFQETLAVGKTFHAQGNLAKALETYFQILSAESEQPTVLYLAGVAFLQSGQIEKAIQFLERSLTVFPNSAEANNNLGVAYNAAGRPNDAERCYRRAIAIRPEYASACKNLGALLASNGRLDAGLEFYRKAINLVENLADAHKAIGDILYKQQKYEEALQSYMQARTLLPMDADVLTSAGLTLQLLSRYQEALKLHSQAINFQPNEDRHWTAFSDCVSSMSFSATNDNLESSLLNLLEKKDLSPATLMFPIISALRHRKEFAHLLDNPDDVINDADASTKALAAITDSKLFIALMARVPIADLRIERLLTKLRCNLLSEVLDQGVNNEQHLVALASIAQQCFINEYAYPVTEQEHTAVAEIKKSAESAADRGEKIRKDLWLIVGCYEALKDLSWKNHIERPTGEDSALRVYELQISAPETEKLLSKSIPQLTEIHDATSQEVRAQYEENPYPRWIHTTRLTSKPVREVLCAPPLSFDLGDYEEPRHIDALVAGCGTGQHAIQAATRFTNTKLTAVDLSLSSLSYAKRKTQEMGLDNIDYIQGDILELDLIGRQFDIIECGGVLHHMSEPLKGWEVLVRLLRDNGLMKIGLYSEKGRPDIVAGRKFINQGGYGVTASEMRRCRQDIISAAEQGDQDLIQLCMRGDFYSLSPCRDLIFHVQEHRFTIPEISRALKILGLEFIGFETPTPQTLVQFRKENPSCPKGNELQRWHKFEERFPDTFRGMYQFWCRKATR